MSVLIHVEVSVDPFYDDTTRQQRLSCNDVISTAAESEEPTNTHDDYDYDDYYYT